MSNVRGKNKDDKININSLSKFSPKREGEKESKNSVSQMALLNLQYFYFKHVPPVCTYTTAGVDVPTRVEDQRKIYLMSTFLIVKLSLALLLFFLINLLVFTH